MINKYLIKIILGIGLSAMIFTFVGCSDETDLIMKHRSVTNAEILSVEKINYGNNCSGTCMKTDKGNFFFHNYDYLKQIQYYYDYKKTENTKPIVSFIYNSNSYEETGNEKIYYVDSIAFNDNLEAPETDAKTENTSAQNNSNNNDISKYGITINNSIDTNTNTSVNNNENGTNNNNTNTSTPTE